ncbi:MAG TPA: hydroxymethylglutaryl-CoA reductase, degradative [Bacteroidetes bacterium]|jgi:hydroxymethylglutaryl-CoA reductase|nr:hydroxymethylglutaryl-CoA reductase, degradative [Bacteroidota bacterium]
MIKGFSKLTKEAKIEWLIANYFNGEEKAREVLVSYWHSDEKLQKLHDEFIENTVSNFYMPMGIAPNFLINGKEYAVPMVTEESSVVAAAAKSANFWADKGGFKATVRSTTKIGHVHFLWKGDNTDDLTSFIAGIVPKFYTESNGITANMRKRGGGILAIQLVDKTADIPHYYQLEAEFETCDSMGANFINSCLEKFADVLKSEIANASLAVNEVEVVMCILSNYTPKCLVKVEVSCPIAQMVEGTDMSPQAFAERFTTAVRIAETQPYRAVTHNKGIMNGIDSVILATGNDFRAIEASAHAYASKDGRYSSLTHADMSDGQFKFWIEVPLALGTVGGITGLHPMVKFAHQMMGNPSAAELMMISAAVGLAQNFSALRSLTTTGIQQGHMKMHLLNILNQLEATEEEKAMIVRFFIKNTPHHAEVVSAFQRVRGGEVIA